MVKLVDGKMAVQAMENCLRNQEGIFRKNFPDIPLGEYLKIINSLIKELKLQKITFRQSDWTCLVTDLAKQALQRGYYAGLNSDLIARRKKIGSNYVYVPELVRLEPNVQYAYDLLEKRKIVFSVHLVFVDTWVQVYSSLQHFLKNIKGVEIRFTLPSGVQDKKCYGLGQLIEMQNDASLTREFRKILLDDDVPDTYVSRRMKELRQTVWLNTSNRSATGEMLVKTALKNFIKVYDTTATFYNEDGEEEKT